MLGSNYVLVALGFTLVFGILHIVNFAHGEMYMLGAYAVFALFAQIGINYWLANAMAIAIVGFLGILIERSLYRPLRGKFLQSMVIGLGLAMILQSVAGVGFGVGDKNIAGPISGVRVVFGVTIPTDRLAVVVVSVALLLAVLLFVHKTKTGRAIRAVAQDPEASALQGVSVDNISALTFAVGSALAAAAGSAMSLVFYINPYMGTIPLLKAFVIVVLGGLGSVPGAILGGFLIGMVDSFALTFLGGIADIAGFMVMLLILVLRPKGLFGHG